MPANLPMRPLLLLAGSVLISACTPGSPSHTGNATPDPSHSTTLTDPGSGALCAGKDLHLTASDTSWVIEGECGDILVTGSHLALNVDTARSLTIQGNNVTVINQRVGAVSVSGNNNTLNLTRIGPLTLDGSHNLVLGHEASSVTFSGQDNAVNVDNTPQIDDRGTRNRVI